LRRKDENAVGVKAYPALVMFKVLLLQSWHNLSDADMEFALHDRFSFCRFAGFSLEDETPDHTTICRFRNLLAEEGLLQKLLDEVNDQLQARGKLVKTGCIVDASIISSAARPTKHVDIEAIPEDRREEDGPDVTVKVSYSHDEDAAWTQKGKKSHYGYKVHMATDRKDGFILSGHATAANRADTKELDTALERSRVPEKGRVFADKGYTSAHNREAIKKRKLKNGIMDKAARNHPLTPRQKKRNRLIIAVRGTVERSFGTLREAYGLARAGYIGTLKVELEFLLRAVAFNLKKAVYLVPR
jgi:IS5 family transposase